MLDLQTGPYLLRVFFLGARTWKACAFPLIEDLFCGSWLGVELWVRDRLQHSN